MRIYDRKLQKYIEEKEYQEGILRFLYHTVLGRILLKVLVARPWLSKAVAIYYKSRLSKKKIIPFIEEKPS
jgi:phosphatidylserine decarboxylase